MRLMKFVQDSKHFIGLFVVGIAMTGFGQTTVTFNLDAPGRVIPNEIFGTLMERLGRQWTGTNNTGVFCGTAPTAPANTNGMRNDVIDAFKECGVGAIEWPGGCASNGYVWGTNKNPANDVGVDRFIQFCKLTGAEAMIAGRPTSADAASNLGFARYILDTLGYPLKWFKVGNEVWGCGGSQTVTTYIPNYTANYNVLKDLKNSANGKNLSIVAGNDLQGRWDWMGTMLKSIGSTIDGLEFHDYVYFPSSISSTSFTTAQYWTIVNDAFAGQVKPHLVTNAIPIMDANDPSKRIKLVEDEWGDWLIHVNSDAWMQQNTVMDALSSAEQLHVFMSLDRVGAACLAQAVSVIHSLLNISPSGTTSGMLTKTPTFYVFKLFKPHHTDNAKWVPITASNIENINGGGTNMPVLTVAATVESHDTVNISFSNIDLTATHLATVTLTSSHVSYKVVSAGVITGSAMNSFNDFGVAEQVNIQTLAASNYSITGKTLTATLPSKSVVMIRLLPTDVGVQTGSPKSSLPDAFSVKAGPRGTVLVSSMVSRKTPVTISLYGVDGGTLMERASRTFGAGNSTCVLGSNSMSSGAYVVSITGKDINISKRVIAAR